MSNNTDWDFFSGVHHFYSPIPSLQHINDYDNIIEKYKDIKDINLNDNKQLENLKIFSLYSNKIPWLKENNQLRYSFENMYFSYCDGLILYSMIMKTKPKRIIEIGSGYSSSLMLDVNQLFFNNSIELTFIEPYPERLKSLLKGTDYDFCRIFDCPVQNVNKDIFSTLEEGDILFIDSSHVTKFGCDLNEILFLIFPLLKRGVLIHFHDIFFPFEQPKNWLEEGRYWNETYLLKAFLMNNNKYDIEFFNDFIWKFYPEESMKYISVGSKNTGGSLWIVKK